MKISSISFITEKNITSVQNGLWTSIQEFQEETEGIREFRGHLVTESCCLVDQVSDTC